MAKLPRPRLQAALTAIFLCLTASGCAREEKAAPDSTEPIREVPVTRVLQRSLYHEFKLPGEILAYQDVPLYPKVPGFIKWIGVDRGSVVKKGQLLCQMIAPELTDEKEEASSKVKSTSAQLLESQKQLDQSQADLAQAEARLNMDQLTYQRMQQAYKVPGVISANELHVFEQTAAQDKAAVQSRQEAVKAAQAKVESVTADVGASTHRRGYTEDIRDYLNITAPYDGVITERNKHVGSFVYPPRNEDYPPMLRLKENSLLRIVIPVPEVAVAGTYLGEPISFTVAAYPGEFFTGEVARIAQSLEVKTRTEPVELNFWNPGWKLSPGMFPEIIWPMRREEPTLFAPSTAVTNNLYQPFVMKIVDEHVKRVPVRRGEAMGDLLEVFGDLQEGDLVALRATDDIADGALVKTHLDTEKVQSVPDPPLVKAKSDFSDKSLQASARDIREAVSELRYLSIHAAGQSRELLRKSISELTVLSGQVESGSVKSVRQLSGPFSRAQYAMAQYHYQNAIKLWKARQIQDLCHSLTQASANLKCGFDSAGVKIDQDTLGVISGSEHVCFQLSKGSGWLASDVQEVISDIGRELEKLRQAVGTSNNGHHDSKN